MKDLIGNIVNKKVITYTYINRYRNVRMYLRIWRRQIVQNELQFVFPVRVSPRTPSRKPQANYASLRKGALYFTTQICELSCQ